MLLANRYYYYYYYYHGLARSVFPKRLAGPNNVFRWVSIHLRAFTESPPAEPRAAYVPVSMLFTIKRSAEKIRRCIQRSITETARGGNRATLNPSALGLIPSADVRLGGKLETIQSLKDNCAKPPQGTNKTSVLRFYSPRQRLQTWSPVLG